LGRHTPGHDGKGSNRQTGRPTHNAIRANKLALIALSVDWFTVARIEGAIR
jgi:hypothetical protein